MKSSAGLVARSLLAMSLGATVAGGGASAQLIPDTFSAPPGATRLIPRPKQQQSPSADACANSGGKFSVEARLAGCNSLIGSGRWKGRDIAWAYANRCILFNAQGQTDKALANCDSAIEQDPQSWLAYQIRGEIAEKLGHPEKATADYDKAIEVGARNAAIFINRGDIFLADGKAEKALADFNRAIELNDQSVKAYIGRGGSRVALGDADSAVTDFSKVIEIAPGNVIAWFNRGAAWLSKGENFKAAEDFTQALKLQPTNAYASLWRFIARSRSGDGDAAKAELQASSTKLSQSAWPWPAVQLFLGDKDGPETLAAAKTPGDQCEAQFYLGEERLLKNARDEALTYFRKAVETCPKNFAEYFQALNELKPPVAAAPKAESAPVKDDALRPSEAPNAEDAPKAPDAPVQQAPVQEAPKAEETKDPAAKP
jgi:tetratricopeptide (TPR) repeat protein